MMMGNDRDYQHYYADEEKEVCKIPFFSHSLSIERLQR